MVIGLYIIVHNYLQPVSFFAAGWAFSLSLEKQSYMRKFFLPDAVCCPRKDIVEQRLTPHVAMAYTTRGVWQNNTSSFSSFPFEVVEMKVPAENNFMARPKLLLALLGESKENL